MSLHHLSLRHPDGVARVIAGHGALDSAAGDLESWLAGRTVFVLSSEPIRNLHGQRLAVLVAPAARVVELSVVDGEAAKTVSAAAGLWNTMLASGGKRDSRFLAFGGGSVGDLGGFVAACFLRGIELVQIPTTLLAQVDAAIGGKTGVDLPAGKNTVGAFHHARWIVEETALLATLSPGELRSGLVEVVKMAYLLDPALLERVEDDLPDLLTGDGAALAPVVAGAAAAKIGVVERDPVEKGERKLLNFGHTLGHAIEAALAYRHLRHGEAVAYGLLFALRLAVGRGFDTSTADRLRRLLARFDLPSLPRLDPDELARHMAKDKKARESGLAWILPAKLGRGEIVTDLSMETVRRELPRFLDDPWG